jgi:hypothetical protein
MFIIDDASVLKLRHETKIMRISNSIKERNIFSDASQIESTVLQKK